MKEETGRDVVVTGMVGLYSRRGDVVVLAAYTAQFECGSLSPGDEVVEVAMFHPDDLPPLPFPHDDEIVRDWRALRSEQG